MKKRIIALIIAVLSVMSVVFAGCSGIEEEEVGDATKTQLYVAIYNGGFGSAWFSEMEKRFEEAHKDDTCWEDGKTGVDVVPYANKDDLEASVLLNTMSGLKYEVFFTEGDYYQAMLDKNLLLDITDAVKTDKLPNETKTIEDKLSDSQKAYFSRDSYNTSNAKYYAAPYYSAAQGLSYNIDLFDQKNLFFAKGGCPSEHLYPLSGFEEGEYNYTNLEGDRSAGPDGEYETFDDGLPATLEDFEIWITHCSEIVTPVTWSGFFGTVYTNYILNAMFYQSENEDTRNLYYNFRENATFDAVKLETIEGKSFETEKVTLTKGNYNELMRQPGRLYSLRMFELLAKYVDGEAKKSSTNVAAQKDFLNDDKEIALLVEGNWWYNEAKDAGLFSLLRKDEKQSNYAMMPLPHATEAQIGSQNVLYDGNNAMIFVNKNIAKNKEALAKEFIKFACTDKSCEEFLSLTGSLRDLSFDIDVNSNIYKNLTPFAKNYLALKNRSTVVYKGYTSPTLKAELNKKYLNEIWQCSVGGSIKVPVTTFFYDSNIHANDLFKGLYQFTK